MRYSITSVIALAWTATVVSAQSAIYGQCGGIGWTGPTTLTVGSSVLPDRLLTMLARNDDDDDYLYYVYHFDQGYDDDYLHYVYHFDQGHDDVHSGFTHRNSSPVSMVRFKEKFKYFGVNESGAEFGNTAWPGVLGTDYIWPAPSSIDYFTGLGFNTFRVTFLMERMSPPATGLTGPFNATYLSGLTTIVDYITAKGAYALIDPHNFMRYDNAVISDTTAFSTWWVNLAAVFKSNANVIFDLQNEPYGIDATTVYTLMQDAVNAIRASGATEQLIVVEGTSYTGAWTWISSGNGAAFAGLTDPSKNIAIEMHQYLDSDGSGTYDTCVNNTIGVNRLEAATQWLQENNFKGLLGEIGAASNTVCIEAVSGAMAYMQEAGSPWLGALWWAAGPWWGTYFMSIEPPSGAAIPDVLPQALEPYLPVS
ncbi:hypothetical protein FRB98_006788 [Tulasnella sp. 332]|nr:hypothetical protein FRB98_006788 [Tulasnella sp. 332]